MPCFFLMFVMHMCQFITMDMALRVSGNKAATLSLQPAIGFLCQLIESGHPANSILVMESKSSLVTSGILYGMKNKELAFTTLPGILEAFIRPNFLYEVTKVSTTACKADTPVQWHQFQENTSCCGGWCGLFLVAKGPTVHVPAHKDEAIELIEG